MDLTVSRRCWSCRYSISARMGLSWGAERPNEEQSLNHSLLPLTPLTATLRRVHAHSHSTTKERSQILNVEDTAPRGPLITFHGIVIHFLHSQRPTQDLIFSKGSKSIYEWINVPATWPHTPQIKRMPSPLLMPSPTTHTHTHSHENEPHALRHPSPCALTDRPRPCQKPHRGQLA